MQEGYVRYLYLPKKPVKSACWVKITINIYVIKKPYLLTVCYILGLACDRYYNFVGVYGCLVHVHILSSLLTSHLLKSMSSNSWVYFFICLEMLDISSPKPSINTTYRKYYSCKCSPFIIVSYGLFVSVCI